MSKLIRQRALLTTHLLASLPLWYIIGTAVATLMNQSSTTAFLESVGILGDVSMLLFLLTLACTPVTILLGWQWTQPLKKPLGLYTFFYALIHYLAFASAFQFEAIAVWAGSTANAMLLMGSLAFFLMIPLALTSNRWSMKILGKNWKRLHGLTYGVAVLIALHLFYLGEGLTVGVITAVLLLIRIPPIRKAIIQQRKHIVATMKSNRLVSNQPTNPLPQQGNSLTPSWLKQLWPTSRRKQALVGNTLVLSLFITTLGVVIGATTQNPPANVVALVSGNSIAASSTDSDANFFRIITVDDDEFEGDEGEDDENLFTFLRE